MPSSPQTARWQQSASLCQTMKPAPVRSSRWADLRHGLIMKSVVLFIFFVRGNYLGGLSHQMTRARARSLSHTHGLQLYFPFILNKWSPTVKKANRVAPLLPIAAYSKSFNRGFDWLPPPPHFVSVEVLNNTSAVPIFWSFSTFVWHICQGRWH